MHKSQRRLPPKRVYPNPSTLQHNCPCCGHRHDDEHLCIPLVLEKYTKLASNIAFKIAKTYRYTDEDCKDVVQDVLTGLCEIPPQYRNIGGVRFWCRTRAINSITARLPYGTSGSIVDRDKHSDWYGGEIVPYASREEASEDGVSLKPGEFISEAQCLPSSEIFAEGESDCGGFDLIHDIESVRKFLPQLTSEQRTVVELYFGLNGKSFSIRQIGRKLARDPRWVRQRLDKGLADLRTLMTPVLSASLPLPDCSLSV